MNGDGSDIFQERTESFLNWLQRLPNSKFGSKIQLADLRDRSAGRGVVATADIEEDEELFSIARSEILSVENSDFVKNETARRYIEELEDPWMSLILVMIYEYLRGDQSPWAAYFGVLPEEFDTLMFWSEEELSHLQACAVKDKIGKAGADEQFDHKIWGFIQQPENRAIFPSSANLNSDYIMALAHRMGSIMMAYAFDLEKEESGQQADEEGYVSDDEDELLPKGMVPLADMLNADADRNNARLFYGENEVTMKALKPIKAGEEIFNDYGPLPRGDLLRRYGYITPNYTQYDVVEVAFDLLADEVEKTFGSEVGSIDKKCEYLDKIGVLEDAYDIARGDTVLDMIPEQLRIAINVLGMEKDDFDSLRKNKSKRPPTDLGPRSKATLRIVLQRRLAQYPSSLAEDRASIAKLEEEKQRNRTANRMLMALHVRVGEKEILGHATSKMGAGPEKRTRDSIADDSKDKRQRRR